MDSRQCSTVPPQKLEDHAWRKQRLERFDSRAGVGLPLPAFWAPTCTARPRSNRCSQVWGCGLLVTSEGSHLLALAAALPYNSAQRPCGILGCLLRRTVVGELENPLDGDSLLQAARAGRTLPGRCARTARSQPFTRVVVNPV